MNVGIFAPYALWTHHFATDLEIAQLHLDDGDEVTILSCQGQLPTCDTNVDHASYACVRCRGIQSAGLRLLSQPVRTESFERLTASDRDQLAALQTRFADTEELRNYEVDGFDVGMAALSSLVSIRRDPEVDLDLNATLLEKLLQSAWVTYRSIFNYLEANPSDRFYSFNARFAPLRGVLRACQRQDVECYIHERGHDRHHYAFYPNTLPHDQALVHKRMWNAWQAAEEDGNREDVGAKWFEDRRQGVAQSWVSFSADQQPHLLPNNWDKNRRNVVIFCSSEDEFVAISDDDGHSVYGSQLEGMQRLIETLSHQSHDLHLYLRIHPNLADVDNRQVRELKQLSAPMLTVIDARNPVSSYALIDAAEKVVTFRSTVGIEAVYWGKPSILVGPSFYVDLGGT